MTDVLVCDTSGLLAALDRADRDHAACVGVLERHHGPLLLSPPVLAELDHLVRTRLGAGAARSLADDVASGAYDLAPLTSADMAACVDVDRAYGDLGIGLADASVVVLAGRVMSRALLTFDHRHLRAVRPLQGEADLPQQTVQHGQRDEVLLDAGRSRERPLPATAGRSATKPRTGGTR